MKHNPKLYTDEVQIIEYHGRIYHVQNRDSQRAKVYEAEHRFRNETLLTDREVRAKFEEITRSTYWAALSKAYKTGTNRDDLALGLKPGITGGGTFRCFHKLGRGFPVFEGRLITINGTAHPTSTERHYALDTLIHELAHALTAGTGHGWPFCSAHIKLKHHVLGPQAAEELRLAYVSNRVKHSPFEEIRRKTKAAAPPRR